MIVILIQRLINQSKYDIKCPYTMTPKGICIHNTANDASASNEISYMGNNNNEVSFHIAIDDAEAIQGISFDRNTWHSGDGGSGQGNRNYISVEICYSKSGGERFKKAEARAVKEVAELCRKYNFTIDNIKAHRDFSDKNCPHRTDINNFRYLVQVELNKINSNLDNKKIFYKVQLKNTQVLNTFDNLNDALENAKLNQCLVVQSNNNSMLADYYPQEIFYKVQRKNGEVIESFRDLNLALESAKRNKTMVVQSDNNSMLADY